MNINTTSQLEMPRSKMYRADKTYGAYWLLLLVSLVLLCLIPDQAAWVSTEHGWYTQPMFGCILGLGVMIVFSSVRVVQSLKALRNTAGDRGDAGGYRTVIVSSLLFLAYIQSLSIVGFLLSTLIFTLTLLWFSQLLNRFWLITNLVTVAALILVFRIILHVWLPDVWLYSLLPDNLADLANQYL